MDPFIHPTAIIDKDCQIGRGTFIWHFCHIRSQAVVGRNCILGKNVYIDQGVSIGNKVKIQNNVSVYHGVNIEDFVFLGPHVTFSNDRYPRSVNAAKELKKRGEETTLVKTGCSIGTNSTILSGITLGEWSMIGAGSLVTKSIPPYALAYGHPAKIHGVVSPLGEILDKNYRPGVYFFNKGKGKFQILSEWIS